MGEKFRYRDALRAIFSISRLGNQYLQSNQPWALLKAGNAARAGSVIALALNLINFIALIVEPFMPDTSTSILAQLNLQKRSVSCCVRFFYILTFGIV